DELIQSFAPSALGRQPLGLQEAGPNAEEEKQAEEIRRTAAEEQRAAEARCEGDLEGQTPQEQRQAEAKRRELKAPRESGRAPWHRWWKIAGAATLFLIIVGAIIFVVTRIDETRQEARLEELRQQAAETVRKLDAIITQNETARRVELQKQQEEQQQQEQS